jgi:predicted ATPase
LEVTIIRLKKIRISGFKALERVTFSVPRDLLLLIGMNGSGKSSTLQALGLIREFIRGEPDEFFSKRNWITKDVKSKLPATLNTFRVDLLFESSTHGSIVWQFSWGWNTKTNLHEIIWVAKPEGDSLIKVFEFKKERLDAPTYRDLSLAGVELKGSVLPLIVGNNSNDEVSSKEILNSVFEWGNGITSLELLSPSAMRKRALSPYADIGAHGEHLASFISQLDAEAQNRIVMRLSEFYPLERLETLRRRSRSVDLRITESFDGLGSINRTQFSDGFLRLLALCAIPEFPKSVSLILLDEVEDGIDPHILPHFIKQITSESSSQFVMTSHSPLLVNFVEADEVAFLGRLRDGRVAAVPFQSFDSVKTGLEYFGSGEIWAMMGREQLDEALAEHVELEPQFDFSRYSNRYTPRAVRNFIRSA